MGMVQSAVDMQPMNQSESNPVLNAPAPVNTRLKLAELNHIPSVKSNLMSQENNGSSQELLNGKVESSGGINIANLPMGKKTVLAPLGNVSPLIGGGKERQVLNSMQNANARGNNRTLKPIQAQKSFKR